MLLQQRLGLQRKCWGRGITVVKRLPLVSYHVHAPGSAAFRPLQPDELLCDCSGYVIGSVLPCYAVAELPPCDRPGALAFVFDGGAGNKPAIAAATSDNWFRVATLNKVIA